jgi:hypothetical protein
VCSKERGEGKINIKVVKEYLVKKDDEISVAKAEYFNFLFHFHPFCRDLFLHLN